MIFSKRECSVTCRQSNECRRIHPLRAIRKITEAVFVELSPQFDKMYARMVGHRSRRRSLLRALLLQVLYSVRSERLLMEELN